MNIEKSQKSEKYNLLELTVREPDFHHGFGTVFVADTEEQASAYNLVLFRLAREREDLHLFHQGGEGDNSGRHYWELLGTTFSKEPEKKRLLVQELIKEVQRRVRL